MAAYLDHAAGSPMRAAAAAALVEALGRAGNPSSVHRHGQAARAMLEDARERLAALLDCAPLDVVLTSGGTESVNLAITGAYRAGAAAGRRGVLAPGGEHAATVETIDALVSSEGAELVPLPVDGDGRLSPAVLTGALDEHGAPALVTALWANNEVGTVNDVPALAGAARAAAVPLHVDAVAAFGSVPVRFRASGAALLSVSAHKVGGPPGIGALVVDRSVRLEPVLHGGGQERGLRSGTQQAAAARAFAVAAEAATEDLEREADRLRRLRDRALAGVLAALPGAVVRGADPAVPGARLPGNLHLTVPGANGEDLLLLLDMAGVSVSTGSACLAGVARVSPVLLAMGLPAEEARGALRITFGHSSTEADVDALLAALPALAAVA
ncbi:aminotransferase class V-fold PLP-dependent enzyme [Amnibacterium sp. CER49]|uniref:cysteine desulfurase family protein n=1 Tax=Amnibacterium sp. CER49 TaxID=3039161 RepID=UPI002448AD32|nr:aminotransferase class V-fold PLP-dependent enzyme [Amnibacterium sp. CER49]MDH2442707.1 aminotransferase class V-fold PLP-dependent enzyme [Amnibacterium sp. CER49]